MNHNHEILHIWWGRLAYLHFLWYFLRNYTPEKFIYTAGISFLKVVAPSFSWQYQQNRKKQKHLCSGLNVRCPTWARVFEHLVPNWWISVKPLAGGSNWRKWVIESRPLSFIAQLHFFLLPDSCDDRVIYVVWFDVCENIKKLACSWFMLKILIKNRLSKM